MTPWHKLVLNLEETCFDKTLLLIIGRFSSFEKEITEGKITQGTARDTWRGHLEDHHLSKYLAENQNPSNIWIQAQVRVRIHLL